MQSSANVVVLSSSPACVSSHTPSQIEHNHEKRLGSPQFSSPTSLVSPSELFKTASTSSFFNTDVSTRKKNPPNTPAGDCDKFFLGEAEKVPDSKPKHRTKKLAKETDTDSGDRNATGSKTTKKSTKVKDGQTTTKPNRCNGSNNNKILTGKVAKTCKKLDRDYGKSAEVILLSPPARDASGEGHYNRENEGLQLEEAMARRLDWTPPKDTTLELDNDETGCSPKHTRHNFGNMLSGYNFSGDIASTRHPNQTVDDRGPTKRRRIELVGNGVFPVPKTDSKKNKTGAEDKPSTRKPKKQQKRTTTITAHATAKYISNDTDDYATPDGDASPTDDLTIEGAINSRLQQKTKRDTTNYTVLPPEAAVESFQNQDLMFGTCSQLERAESPTALEETQLAIPAFEKRASTEQNSRTSRSRAPVSSSSSTVSRFAGARNLWCAAARDLKGSKVQAEVVDLVDSPYVPRTASVADDSGAQDSWFQIDDHPDPEPVVASSSDNTTTEKRNTPPAIDRSAITGSQQHKESASKKTESHAAPMPHYTGFTDAELSKAVAAYGFKSIKSRVKMIDLLQKCWVSKHGKTASTTTASDTDKKGQGDLPNTSRMPQPGLHLVEQRESAYGNSSTKASSSFNGNKKPQHQESLDAATNRKSQATSTGKRKQETSNRTSAAPRRKYTKRNNPTTPPPAKPSSSSFLDVEEIDDSEDDEAIPSPSRLLQNLYTKNNNSPRGEDSLPISTIPLSPSPNTSKLNNKAYASTTFDLDSPSSSRTENLPDLAAQITRAIYSQPRLPLSSTNKRLRWHEKILMYDPIVLEDFATWLNVEGLGLVGEDREVSAGFLRRWCEGRGICCCYRKGDGW